MANNKINPWVIVLIGLVVAYIAIPGFQDTVKGVFTPSDKIDILSDQCLAYDGTTLYVGNMEYKFDPTTSAATETSDVYKKYNGDYVFVDSKNKTQSIETQPGDQYKIIYAADSSVFYANEAMITVPCAAAFYTSEVDNGAYLVVANKTPTITVFNDDDGLKNTATNNESLAANDVANLDMKIVYASKGGWSPNGDNIITVKVNSTVISDVTLSSSEVTVTPADVPSFRSSTNSTTGCKLYSFKHPGIETESTKTIRYTLTLESSSTEPTGGATHQHVIFLDDEDFYRDSDTGKPAFGAEDEDDADVGHTTEIATIIYLD